MSVIPIISSAADLPGAIKFAERHKDTRWYVAKRMESLGAGDRVPAGWGITAAAGVPTSSDPSLPRRHAAGKIEGMDPVTAAGDFDTLHPRDRNGQFIEKLDILNVFEYEGDLNPMYQMQVTGVRMGSGGTVVLDGKRTDGGNVSVAASKVEAAPEAKARLDGATHVPDAGGGDMTDDNSVGPVTATETMSGSTRLDRDGDTLGTYDSAGQSGEKWRAFGADESPIGSFGSEAEARQAVIDEADKPLLDTGSSSDDAAGDMSADPDTSADLEQAYSPDDAPDLVDTGEAFDAPQQYEDPYADDANGGLLDVDESDPVSVATKGILQDKTGNGADPEFSQGALDGLRPYADFFNVDSGRGSWASGLSDYQFDSLANYVGDWGEDPESVPDWAQEALTGAQEFADEFGNGDAWDAIQLRKEAADLGWAQSEQMQAVLQGDPFGEQNSNALANIGSALEGVGGPWSLDPEDPNSPSLRDIGAAIRKAAAGGFEYGQTNGDEPVDDFGGGPASGKFNAPDWVKTRDDEKKFIQNHFPRSADMEQRLHEIEMEERGTTADAPGRPDATAGVQDLELPELRRILEDGGWDKGALDEMNRNDMIAEIEHGNTSMNTPDATPAPEPTTDAATANDPGQLGEMIRTWIEDKANTRRDDGDKDPWAGLEDAHTYAEGLQTPDDMRQLADELDNVFGDEQSHEFSSRLREFADSGDYDSGDDPATPEMVTTPVISPDLVKDPTVSATDERKVTTMDPAPELDRGPLEANPADIPVDLNALSPGELQKRMDDESLPQRDRDEARDALRAKSDAGVGKGLAETYSPKTAPAETPAVPPSGAPANPEAASKLGLMTRSASKPSSTVSEADANSILNDAIATADAGDGPGAHAKLAGLMTSLKLGGKQRKRYRELLDDYLGSGGGGEDSAKVEAAAVADNLSDSNPVKEKLAAKAADAKPSITGDESASRPESDFLHDVSVDAQKIADDGGEAQSLMDVLDGWDGSLDSLTSLREAMDQSGSNGKMVDGDLRREIDERIAQKKLAAKPKTLGGDQPALPTDLVTQSLKPAAGGKGGANVDTSPNSPFNKVASTWLQARSREKSAKGPSAAQSAVKAREAARQQMVDEFGVDPDKFANGMMGKKQLAAGKYDADAPASDPKQALRDKVRMSTASTPDLGDIGINPAGEPIISPPKKKAKKTAAPAISKMDAAASTFPLRELNGGDDQGLRTAAFDTFEKALSQAEWSYDMGGGVNDIQERDGRRVVVLGIDGDHAPDQHWSLVMDANTGEVVSQSQATGESRAVPPSVISAVRNTILTTPKKDLDKPTPVSELEDYEVSRLTDSWSAKDVSPQIRSAAKAEVQRRVNAVGDTSQEALASKSPSELVAMKDRLQSLRRFDLATLVKAELVRRQQGKA